MFCWLLSTPLLPTGERCQHFGLFLPSGCLSSGSEVPAGLSVGPAAPKPHIQAGSTVLEPGKVLTKALGACSTVGFQLFLCRIVSSPQKTES